MLMRKATIVLIFLYLFTLSCSEQSVIKKSIQSSNQLDTNLTEVEPVIDSSNNTPLTQEREITPPKLRVQKTNNSVQNNSEETQNINIENIEIEKPPSNNKVDKLVELKNEIRKLKELKLFYFDLHNQRILNRFNRAISYTNLSEEDYSLNLLREGENKEHLEINLQCFIDIEDIVDQNENYSELTSALLKSLADYLLIISLEKNNKIQLQDFNSLFNIKVNSFNHRIKYNEKTLELLEEQIGKKYLLNNELVEAKMPKDSLLHFADIGFLLCKTLYDELAKTFNTDSSSDLINVYLTNEKRIIIYINLKIFDLFKFDYYKHLKEVEYSDYQIGILEDSIKVLESKH